MQTSEPAPTPVETDDAVGTDVPGEIDVNPASLIERIDTWVDTGVKLIPNIVAALVVVALFFALSRVIARALRRRADRAGNDNLGEALESFTRVAMPLLGLLLAVTIVFPSITPGRVMSTFGIGSVAIGFAFKDILQNWLAGMLILTRKPFEVGDQIKMKEFEGTVRHIQTRATLVETYDGIHVLIPNSELYVNSVEVKTGDAVRRTQYDLTIASDEDMHTVLDLVKATLTSIDTIEQDPAPEAFVWELSAKSYTVRARWWTDSRRSDVVHNQAAFMLAVKTALDTAGIDMSFDSEIRLVQDPSEDVPKDGPKDGPRDGPRDGPGKAGPAATAASGSTAKANSTAKTNSMTKAEPRAMQGDEAPEGNPQQRETAAR